MSSALHRSTPASPSWARAGIGRSRSKRTTARLVGTIRETTLGLVTGARTSRQTVRYRERLWVPWWWWLVGFGVSAVFATEVNMGVRNLPNWSPYAVLGMASVGVLLWLSRTEVQVTDTGSGLELLADQAHLPASAVASSAAVPRSAKSAALGRQLDPAAFVVHRSWVGPMALVVLDDADDPTPYWLVSCRHPERMLAALRS